MIEALTFLPDNILGFVCKGHVTRADYETVLVPKVEAALHKHEKLRLYYEIADDFIGIAPGAMWEDFKVGMGHLRHWERLALVTDVEWIRQAVRLFAVVMPCETRTFPLAESAQARAWLTGA